MKTTLLVALKTISVCAILALFATSASARIGETKNDIQDRMFTKTDGAYVYQSKEERLREALELPYKYMFLIMPDSVNQVFIFKRPDSSASTTSDVLKQHELYGWELNLALKEGKSVLEFYRRHGDPITKNELVALFDLQKKDDVHWKKSDFINSRKIWNIELKNGKPAYAVKDSKNISDLLPKIPERFIYVEIPDDVLKGTDYPQSLQFQMMEYEQRNAYANYNKYLDQKANERAAKTKKPKYTKNKPQPQKPNAGARKVTPMDSYTHRFVETEFFSNNDSTLTRTAYAIEDIFLIDRPLTSPTKDVRLTIRIPEQPDTAFGYSYETSDGTVRAKLYKNSVLFIDAKFDKSMREYMEELHKKQNEKREQDAKDSVSKF